VSRRKLPRNAVAGGFAPGTPFNPMGSFHDTLAPEGIYPYCAMLQIAEEDKYTDYVMCRGFDTRMRKFVDYEEGDATKPGIAVAKPWGNRVKCYYQKWSVYPCLLPTQQGADKVSGGGSDDFTSPSPGTVKWRVGQNPGKPVASCLGQTQASDDVINEMMDHNKKYVNWMMIDSGPVFVWAYLLHNLYTCGQAQAAIAEVDDEGAWCDPCEHTTIVVTDSFGTVASSALSIGVVPDQYIPAGSNVLVHRVMFPGETTPPRNCQWAAVTFGSQECCVERSTLSVGSGSSSSAGANPCVFGDCSWRWIEQINPETGEVESAEWISNTDTCAILTNCQCSQADPPDFDGDYDGHVKDYPCEEIIPT